MDLTRPLKKDADWISLEAAADSKTRPCKKLAGLDALDDPAVRKEKHASGLFANSIAVRPLRLGLQKESGVGEFNGKTAGREVNNARVVADCKEF